MTYGLRINFEYYFLQNAQGYINKANKASKQEVFLSKLMDIKFPKFIRYKLIHTFNEKYEELKTEQTVNYAMACLMISFGYEALLNYLYRISINKTSENAGDIETKDEIKRIKYRSSIFSKSCEIHNITPSIFDEEIKILENIYSSRNAVVHYKEATSYQGFSFKNPIESQFTFNNTSIGLSTLKIFISKVQTHFELNNNELDIFKRKHFLNL